MDYLNGLTNSYNDAVYNRMSSDMSKAEKLKETLENNDSQTDEELMEACRTFEGYFLQMMYKSMRATVDDSGSFIPKSNGEKIFQDMLDEENCKNISEGSGVGLAKMLYKQLSRHNNKI